MTSIRTPTVLQMEATECGAAALGSILAYYGCYLPLEELRIACGVSRDGSKAVNMLKAARLYGLNAHGATADLDGLQKIKAPFIIFWEFNHYIVIDEIKKNKVYINDPATGPRIISRDALNKGFTGVCLIFEPTKNIIKTSKKTLLRESLKEPILANTKAYILIILTSLFLIVPGIIIPGFSKIFIDNILIQNMKGWFYPLIIGLLISMLLQTLLVFVQQRVLLQLKIKMILSSGAHLIWHVIHLPMQFFYQRYAGDIGDRINANDRIANLLSIDLTSSIVGVFSMIFFAAILLFINFKLACIGILSALINVGVLTSVLRRIEDKTRDFLQQYGRLTGMEMSSLQMIETIKATGLEDDFFKRWSSRHAYVIALQQQIAFYYQFLVLMPQLIYGLSNLAILALGSVFIMQGHLTVGGLIAFLSLLMQFYMPLNILLRLGNSLQQIRGDLLRINDVLHYTPDEQTKEQKEQTVGEHFDITPKAMPLTIKDLVFGYSILAQPLIQDFNLEIPARYSVAFIGKTGSGKSTLAKLFMNLYKPWAGKICLNNTELSTISPDLLANSIAMVEQDIFLFEGSIRNNLSLWDLNISDELLIDALKCAELYEELLPRGGLNCVLEEGGSNLSGGQRQRLEIARALIKGPKLLLLDESTSSLDPPLEKKIFNNLKKLQITLIVITHRISAIRDCDSIIIMEHGKMIHQGTHEELLKTERYKQLVELEGQLPS